MYIVLIEGSDPFIAENKEAIEPALLDLFGGHMCRKYASANTESITFLWVDSGDESIHGKAIKSEVYK